MNPLTYSHSFFSLFVSSFRLYRKHFLPMVLLTGVLLIPSMLLGIGGWIETESVLFMLMMHILEGAMTLGVIGLAFGLTFPIVGILNTLRSRVFWGAMHIAVLQYLLWLAGVIGMTLPFPINVMMVSLWLFSLFAFSPGSTRVHGGAGTGNVGFGPQLQTDPHQAFPGVRGDRDQYCVAVLVDVGVVAGVSARIGF